VETIPADDGDISDESSFVALDPRSCVIIATFKEEHRQATTSCMLFPDLQELITQLQAAPSDRRPSVRITKIEQVPATPNKFVIKVCALHGVCPFVWVDCRSLAITIDDNAFTVLPSKPRNVIVTVANTSLPISLDLFQSHITAQCLWDIALN
jgi:hypothetical protein